MAIIESIFGKFRGRLGDTVFYEDSAGRTLCRSTGGSRKPSGEKQKRWNCVFGTLSELGAYLASIIQYGFPGEKDFPKGSKGFIKANSKGVVTTELLRPGQALSRRRKATKEFRAKIDYAKLRIASGTLAPPRGEALYDKENNRMRFKSEACPADSFDCYTDDRIFAVVLNKATFHHRMVEIGTRGHANEREVDLFKNSKSKNLKCYLFAISADGAAASDSVYLPI